MSRRSGKPTKSARSRPLGPGAGRVCGVALLLLVVLAWPLAHRVLVSRHQLDPALFAGFAGHASWARSFVVPVDPAAGATRDFEVSLPLTAREEIARYRRERAAFGRLRRPDAVAASLFEARPELERLVVAVERLSLDPDDGRLVSNKLGYLYEREAFALDGVSLEMRLR